jgi:hypothetical protein
MVLVLLLLLALAATTPALLVAFGFAMRALWTGARLPPPPPDVPADARLRAALGVFALEWLATVRVIVTWPLGLSNPRTEEVELPRAVRPVLLLPGYGLTRSSMWPLGRFLAGAGVVAVSSWTPPLLAEPRRMASRLVSRLRAISEAAGDLPVDVVAFGASGVLLGEALASDPSCPLGRVIALGTPHRGSPMNVYWPGPGAPALLPDRPALIYWNEVLADTLSVPLPGAVDDGGPRWVSVRSAEDPWVPGVCGEVPIGAVEVLVHRTGHLRLLHAADSFAAVRDALRPGEAGSLRGGSDVGPADQESKDP